MEEAGEATTVETKEVDLPGRRAAPWAEGSLAPAVLWEEAGEATMAGTKEATWAGETRVKAAWVEATWAE